MLWWEKRDFSCKKNLNVFKKNWKKAGQIWRHQKYSISQFHHKDAIRCILDFFSIIFISYLLFFSLGFKKKKKNILQKTRKQRAERVISQWLIIWQTTLRSYAARKDFEEKTARDIKLDDLMTGIKISDVTVLLYFISTRLVSKLFYL